LWTAAIRYADGGRILRVAGYYNKELVLCALEDYTAGRTRSILRYLKCRAYDFLDHHEYADSVSTESNSGDGRAEN